MGEGLKLPVFCTLGEQRSSLTLTLALAFAVTDAAVFDKNHLHLRLEVNGRSELVLYVPIPDFEFHLRRDNIQGCSDANHMVREHLSSS